MVLDNAEHVMDRIRSLVSAVEAVAPEGRCEVEVINEAPPMLLAEKAPKK